MILRTSYDIVRWTRKRLEELERHLRIKLLVVYTGWASNSEKENQKQFTRRFESLDRIEVKEKVEAFLQLYYPDDWELGRNGFQYVFKGKDSGGSDVIGWVDDRPSKFK